MTTEEPQAETRKSRFRRLRNGNGNGKTPRSVTLIAALGLVIITSATVGGLTYDLIVNGNSQSVTLLGNIALLGIGALVALAGNGDKKRNNPED